MFFRNFAQVFFRHRIQLDALEIKAEYDTALGEVLFALQQFLLLQLLLLFVLLLLFFWIDLAVSSSQISASLGRRQGDSIEPGNFVFYSGLVPYVGSFVQFHVSNFKLAVKFVPDASP